MPHTYQRTFHVRQYECDPFGHLNHANYLRFMETAAIEASADAGFDATRYELMGLVWHIRETFIEYLQPALTGEPLAVTTWVADFRRVRSRRMYEFHQPTSGELIARAHTDWVLLERDSGRPASVPDNMIHAFFPEGAPATAPRRQPFPAPPPPPAGAFTSQRRVEWRDLDTAQHVNNANYLAYMESAAMDNLRHNGWPIQRCREAGFLIVAHRFHLEYRLPALMDDTLAITTWISDVKQATAVRHYTIKRPADGELLARGRGQWVWVDANTGRPLRIPEAFMADFQNDIAAEPAAEEA